MVASQLFRRGRTQFGISNNEMRLIQLSKYQMGKQFKREHTRNSSPYQLG